MVYHAGEAQPHVPELPAKSNMDNNIAIVDRKDTSHPGAKICDDPEKS